MNSSKNSSVEMSESFMYLHGKAEQYLEKGVESYRNLDAFEMPPKEWDEEVLDKVRSGMEQIFNLRGHSPESPLEGLGIRGFYALLETFHFELLLQAVVGQDETTFLDEMHMNHQITGQKLTLYNKVSKLHLE